MEDDLKKRSKSLELQILESLNTRMKLGQSEKQHYLNLKKGYEGEVEFDTLTASLESKFYILKDLLLKSSNTTFQIDSLLITQEAIIPCEVKNYEGDYYYENENFYKRTTRKEITNPLHQLNRIETLLRQLLHKNGYTFPVRGYLIFINPKFFLYQAPQNEKIIFVPQLNHFLQGLDTNYSPPHNLHRKLAEQLVKLHLTDSPYSRLPAYHYEHLRKGRYCGICQSFQISVSGRKLVCTKCGHQEKINDAVVRSVEELKLLFPDKKITTNLVHDWCQLEMSERMIARILKQHYKIMGYGQWSYYE